MPFRTTGGERGARPAPAAGVRRFRAAAPCARLAALLLPALLLLPAPLQAQGSAAFEAAVGAYLQALSAGRWQQAAGLLHPRAAEDFKSFWLAALRADPREAPRIVRGVFGLRSVAELDRLSPAEVYARYLQTAARLQPAPHEALRTASLVSAERIGDRASVTYALTLPGGRSERVLRLERVGEGWRLLLPPELQELVDAILSPR